MGRTTSGCAFVYRQDACYLSTLSHSSGFLVGNNHLHVTEMTPPPPPPPPTHTHTLTHTFSLSLSCRFGYDSLTSRADVVNCNSTFLSHSQVSNYPFPLHPFTLSACCTDITHTMAFRSVREKLQSTVYKPRPMLSEHVLLTMRNVRKAFSTKLSSPRCFQRRRAWWWSFYRISSSSSLDLYFFFFFARHWMGGGGIPAISLPGLIWLPQ